MNMTASSLVAAAALVAAASAFAQATPDHAAHHGGAASAPAAQAQALADGEVRKVDKDQGKLTLRHGPIANLDMPPMTMVFRVADPKLLDALKPGDKVRFAAERIGGAITVTAVEPVR